MTLKSSSHKQFTAMFKQSAKQTMILPILAFLCLLFFSALRWDFEPTYKTFVDKTPYFWDDLRTFAGVIVPANCCFVGAGLINALTLFSFVWSKKHSNVIFSLGMSRKDIYFAKVLGGIVPMTVAILAGAAVEVISCAAADLTIDARFWAMAALTTIQYIIIYIFAFVFSCAILSNTGNVVEGLIFTAILSAFSFVFAEFLEGLFWGYTHGAATMTALEVPHPQVNWYMPFFAFYNLDNEGFMKNYFDFPDEVGSLTVYHWSGIIFATVYAVIVCLLGYLAFRKRRNEIGGTWGRAKGLNEIVSAAVGFYAFVFVTFVLFGAKHGNGNIASIVAGLVTFLAASVIFKLVFGNKRKKEFVATLKHFPAYIAGFAAFFIIFSCGLFGYSSEIPDADEIESVKIASPHHIFMEDALSTDSMLALYPQNSALVRPSYSSFSEDSLGYSYYLNEIFTGIIYSKQEDIARVTDIHKKLIEDGKIKDNAADAVGTYIEITYTLKDGSIVKRYYSEATEELVWNLILLNDTDSVKYTLKDYLGTTTHNTDEYLKHLFNTTDYEEVSTSISTQKYIELYHDGNFNAMSKVSDFILNECFLFPKDMSKGYNLGYIDTELYKAIAADMENMSAKQYYAHSAEDEIGVLAFGLSSYYILDEEGYLLHGETETIPEGGFGVSSWNLNSWDTKTVVLTKDMENTIKYLEKHDLMKHFENHLDIGDIKHVRLATLTDLYEEDNRSMNCPVFYASYWTGEQMEIYTKPDSHFNMYRPFDNVDTVIEDKTEIQKLLDNAVLYGFCTNKNQIMEITYDDGGTATVMIQ